MYFWCKGGDLPLTVLHFWLHSCSRDKWVPATRAWCVLKLRMEKWPPIWRVAMNILIKQPWTADKGWSSTLVSCKQLLTVKCILLQNIHAESLRPGLILWYNLSNKKGTWHLELTAAARELARYKLDSVGVQEVRWDKGGTGRAGDYIFFYGKGNENHQLGTGLLYTTEQYQQLRQ